MDLSGSSVTLGLAEVGKVVGLAVGFEVEGMLMAMLSMLCSLFDPPVRAANPNRHPVFAKLP
jgi:hypothetical protein